MKSEDGPDVKSALLIRGNPKSTLSELIPEEQKLNQKKKNRSIWKYSHMN